MTTKGSARVSNPDELILDILSLDSGWLTTAGISIDFPRTEHYLEERLRRLRDEGRVECRRVELGFKPGSGVRADSLEYRWEWKAVV